MSQDRKPSPSIEIRNFPEPGMTLDVTTGLGPLLEVIAGYISYYYFQEINERLTAIESHLAKPLPEKIKALEQRIAELERQADSRESYEEEMRDRGE